MKELKALMEKMASNAGSLVKYKTELRTDTFNKIWKVAKQLNMREEEVWGLVDYMLENDLKVE